MLTAGRGARAAVLRALGTVVLAVLCCVTVPAATAAAAPGGFALAAARGCTHLVFNVSTGKMELKYDANCGGRTPPPPGSSPPPGVGGPPPCDLVDPATFCRGQLACWYSDQIVPLAPPTEPKPTPNSVMKAIYCYQGGIPTGEDVVWYDPAQPPVPTPLQLAQQAFGALRIPTGTLAFQPSGQTLVGFRTSLWVAGLPSGPLTGSSALGMVAIATPDHLVVDPGDGSGKRTCPWATAATTSGGCAYTYQTASVLGTARVGGLPAYAATAQAVWAVHFEQNGNVIAIAGAPTQLTSPAWTTAVPVSEIQSLVQ